MKLDFKLLENTDSEQREAVLAQVKSLGAKQVRPLFPDESDAELATMYTADGVPDSSAHTIAAAIDALDGVEYAERTATRRAI